MFLQGLDVQSSIFESKCSTFTRSKRELWRTSVANNVETLTLAPAMETINMEGPVSIKEILAQLDGKFPMDEAVVEGDDFPTGQTKSHHLRCFNLYSSLATRNYLSVSGELRYKCLDDHREGHGD